MWEKKNELGARVVKERNCYYLSCRAIANANDRYARLLALIMMTIGYACALPIKRSFIHRADHSVLMTRHRNERPLTKVEVFLTLPPALRLAVRRAAEVHATCVKADEVAHPYPLRVRKLVRAVAVSNGIQRLIQYSVEKEGQLLLLSH